MSNIISSVMLLFGINQVPTTVSEYLWCIITLVVGLYIVKYVWLFFSDLFTEMLRMR